MTTQREVTLEVLLQVTEFVNTLVPGNKKEQKAKDMVAKLLAKRIATLNKQLDKYFSKQKQE